MVHPGGIPSTGHPPGSTIRLGFKLQLDFIFSLFLVTLRVCLTSFHPMLGRRASLAARSNLALPAEPAL